MANDPEKARINIMQYLPRFHVNPALVPYYTGNYNAFLDWLADCETWEMQKVGLRHAILNDLFFCVYYIFSRHDINDYDTPFLCRAAREVQSGGDNNVVDLWARGHYKSTLITQGRTLQRLLGEPGMTAAIFSHTRPSAKGFMNPIRIELESNPILKHCFPEVVWENYRTQAPQWSQDDGIVLRRPSQSNTNSLEAWGLVDGMPTGKHFRLRIYDDVVTDKTVGTEGMIQKVEDSISLSDNLGTTDGKGEQRFVGTIYHHADYYAKLRRQADTGVFPWQVRIKPWYDVSRQEAGLGKSPVLLSVDEIKEKRIKQGSRIFSCQMELNPVLEAMREVRLQDLREYRRLPELMNLYLLCDPANEKKKHSDYTAMAVLGIDAQDNRFLIAAVRDRLNLGEREAFLRSLVKRYPAVSGNVWVEKYGKDSDDYYYRECMRRYGVYYELNTMGGAVPKNDRIRRLIPRIEAHQVFMPESGYVYKGEDMVMIIKEELEQFPFGQHDDLIDCISRIEDPEVNATAPVSGHKVDLEEQIRDEIEHAYATEFS